MIPGISAGFDVVTSDSGILLVCDVSGTKRRACFEAGTQMAQIEMLAECEHHYRTLQFGAVWCDMAGFCA
jgi:hypothetical protein